MGLQFAGRWFGRCPASTLESICLAVDTNGCPVYIDWCERHLLTIGESDSGKGSVLANLLVQVEPFAQAGLVRLYGIDLKAMELSMSPRNVPDGRDRCGIRSGTCIVIP